MAGASCAHVTGQTPFDAASSMRCSSTHDHLPHRLLPRLCVTVSRTVYCIADCGFASILFALTSLVCRKKKADTGNRHNIPKHTPALPFTRTDGSRL